MNDTLNIIKIESGGVLHESPEQKTGRNYGIDALRIFSMFLVVILHILGHGGVLENATGTNKHIAWLLEIAAYCAVDIYALISGYVGYTDSPKSFRTAKFLTMWAQVFCYSFGITLCAFLIKPESIGVITLIRSIFPVASDQYWFFSCYAALYFLMPWLNRFIRSIENKDLTQLVAVLFGLFSLYMVFVGRLSSADPFMLKDGYSTVWLIVLYVIGAWMKRIDITKKMQVKYAWLVVIICVLTSWLFKDVITGFIQTGVFVDYVSPTILLSAMAYLVIFAKMKPNKVMRKVITFFAPAAFGVYLIHVQPIVYGHYMSNVFVWIANVPIWTTGFIVIGCSLVILIGCLLIEKLRLLLFEAFRINRLMNIVGSKLDKSLNRISDRIWYSILGGE